MELKKRPRVLFLAYSFPPITAVASVRTWNIATQLAKLGWDVTVVTVDPSIRRDVGDPENVSTDLDRTGIKLILTGHRWRFLWASGLKCWNQSLGWLIGGVCRILARILGIDRHIGWIKEAERACSNLCPKDVDVILATGSPFVAFRLARSLSDRLGRPYVLDYRDPWTANPHHGDRALRPATIREEASLLQGCAAVTIVSPSWGADLDRRYGVGVKTHVITNGYDSNEITTIKPQDFGHCAIVYTGNFYPPRRIISPFLTVLQCLKGSSGKANAEWYFHYYGGEGNHVSEQAAQLDLNDRIVLHGKVPRHEALSAVKGASLAVVIVSIEEQASSDMAGMVPAKIFEAIGLGTPVLLIAPNGSDATTVTTSTGLVKSFTASDTHGMALYVRSVIRGEAPKSENIDAFSWQRISRNLDAVLRQTVPSNDHAKLVGQQRESE